MKKIVQNIIFIILLVFLILVIQYLIPKQEIGDQVFAASGSSTSDIQLMARAINGEARGEPYEGQVAIE